MRRLALLGSIILALSAPVIALADGGPHGKTLTGTLTANPSGSVTVTATSAALTCTVPSRAITSVAKLHVGTKVRIACRKTDGGALVLTGIQPLASHDDHQQGHDGSGGDHSTGTTTTGTTTTTTMTTHSGDGDHGSGTTPPTTTTGTTTTNRTPPPPPPTTQPREVVGVVFYLSHDGMAVRPDAGGTVMTCAITPAPDSAAAAAKLTLNGHFAVICRLDGTRLVLSGASPVK